MHVVAVSIIPIVTRFDQTEDLIDDFRHMDIMDCDVIILIKPFYTKSNILWWRDPHILDLRIIGCISTYLGYDIILM